MAASDILRFATAGSVDDGKSSLIGRLLYDSKAILEDQMLSIERASHTRGSGQLELALLTDGLRAEREQNITIDVAYRYFATEKRKFIIADTPGHVQYTRNMVTGSSTADLSVILVDARKGILSQSRRHAAISALLGIRQVVVAVNKMDLVEFDAGVYQAIVDEFSGFAQRLGITDVTAIPISALLGDNVVEPSENMPWYTGPTLLSFLEKAETSKPSGEGLRLPIQFVIRPNQGFRGFAGQLESGNLCVGDPVTVASTGLTAHVDSILVSGREVEAAESGDAVTITLDREIDVSRGDLLFSPFAPPLVDDRVEALVCWMHEKPLEIGRRYQLLHLTSRVSATVERVSHKVDVDSLDPLPASSLEMNEIGRVVLRTSRPLHYDRYSDIPATGSFVLVDVGSHSTVAGGMIQGPACIDEELGRQVGRLIWLDGFEGDLEALGRDLRRFGKHVVTIGAGQLDDASIEPVVSLLIEQGVDVLVSGVAFGDRLASQAIKFAGDQASVMEFVLAM